MDVEYDDLMTDELFDQCEQVRSIAKKSWLSSASVSLAHLDNVKAKVYNVGLMDPKDLKATNLWTKKKGPDIPLEVPLSSNTAWGSNTSIPETVQQHGETLSKPTRPASAKVNGKWTRPPSGKKLRPQSAKEPIQIPCSEVEVENKQGFGVMIQNKGYISMDEKIRKYFVVKGAKYDPNGRPPKGLHFTTTVGWVGPPAGLKYPDKPTNGNSWKIDFPMDNEEEQDQETSQETESIQEDTEELPHPPHTTPIPPTPEPEEKTKRIFELYIGDPYKEEDDFIQSDSEGEEFGPSYTAYKVTSSTHLEDEPIRNKNEPPESLRLDLPQVDDDYDEIDEVDTERLLAEAESVTQKLDLQSIISSNKHIPQSTATGHVTDQSTNQETAGESSANKIKAKKLVSEIIDEHDLEFDKPKGGDKNCDKKNDSLLEHEKSSVKFNEDVRTVSITPRNIGRKVEDIHHGKKRHSSIPYKADGFVDLIEVKNRIEPVLSTSKAELSKQPVRSPPSLNDSNRLSSLPGSRSRPPSGSSSRPPSGSKSRSTVKQNGCEKSNGPPMLHTTDGKSSARPRSAPMNRAPKPITTVTVDYGEVEEKTEKVDKVKKKKKKGFDDVETVIGAMSRSNTQTKFGVSESPLNEKFTEKYSSRKKNDIENIVNDESEHSNADILHTVIKSDPEKNYYEISRHSSLSNYSLIDDKTDKIESANKTNNNVNANVPVIKTTKTLEFDEVKPKETTIRNVIDAQTYNNKEKELFLQSLQPKVEARPKSRLRPSSAKPSAAKPNTEDEERPGSRIGFVPMAPESRHTDEQKNKTLSRPSSAPVQRSKKSTQKVNKGDKENVNTEDTKCTKQEKDEREKVIDNLLERTKTLLEDCDQKLQSEEPTSKDTTKKLTRPTSAHVGLITRPKDNRRVKSATTKRPVSSTTTRHRHYASYSHGSNIVKTRKSSGKTKTKIVLTEPCIINSNTHYFEEETEEDLACKDLQKNLADKGLNIAAETLQRALYPPSGKSRHYQITADLPKRTSLSLLSHPKVWLPQEYKRLQQAEKSLSRANEIMYLQKKAEDRRAKLEAMGPEERKKMKKKGKKGAKKLRKSQSLG